MMIEIGKENGYSMESFVRRKRRSFVRLALGTRGEMQERNENEGKRKK